MKKATIFLFAVAIFLVSPQTSFACSCGPSTVAEALKRANAVFIGRVIAIESDGVKFKVVKYWKGADASIIKVYVRHLGSSCDPGIRKGRRFIVYAYPGGHRIPLLASYCGRTRVLEQADEDVRELNESALQLHAKPNELRISVARGERRREQHARKPPHNSVLD